MPPRTPPPPSSSPEERLAVLEVEMQNVNSTLDTHDDMLSQHQQQLSKGAVTFEGIAKDLASITGKLDSLNETVRAAMQTMAAASTINWWVVIGQAVINWAVPIAMIAILWLVVASRAIPLQLPAPAAPAAGAHP